MRKKTNYKFQFPSIKESLLDEPGVAEAIHLLHKEWSSVQVLLNPRDLSLRKDVLSQFVRQVMECNATDQIEGQSTERVSDSGQSSPTTHKTKARMLETSPFTNPIQVVNKPGVDEAIQQLASRWEHARQCLHRHDQGLCANVLTRFVREALGYPTHLPDQVSGVWVEAQPGTLRAGDTVRVKSEAFSGEVGERHNSRICEVLWAEGGEVIVESRDGRSPFLQGTHYSPHDLEYLAPAD